MDRTGRRRNQGIDYTVRKQTAGADTTHTRHKTKRNQMSYRRSRGEEKEMDSMPERAEI
jgi:hypothetical protein